MIVEHSETHPSDRSDMDESQLEPFGYITEVDGFTCKCHGWEVQRSTHVTMKYAPKIFGETGTIG